MIPRRRFLSSAGVWCGASFGTMAWRAAGDDWPQWRGPKRDGRWREAAIIDKLPAGQLPLAWDVPIGPGYSGPVVAEGRVLVTDKWEGESASERILCFQEATGELLWKHEYPCRYTINYSAGPRASVTVDGGIAYALGAMGHLHAIEAATGRVIWQRDLNTDYQIEMPIWGIAASPLVYQDLLILPIGGQTGASVVALERNSGQERWRALGDRAQYSAPILIQQAKQDVVVVWTGDSIAGLAPDSGQVHWQLSYRPWKMPIGVATPVIEKDHLFVSSFYDGSMMIRVPRDELKAEFLWSIRGKDEKQTQALHAMIGTPILRDGYIYGVDSYGQLRCLDARDGRRLWEDTTATPQERWSTIHMVEQGDQVWMFNELGELILAHLSPDGYHELGRAQLIAPTLPQLSRRGGRGVCWAHPAFANRHIFARSDERLVSATLAMTS
jgi:outer membrane protein assembly factor BamB